MAYFLAGILKKHSIKKVLQNPRPLPNTVID